VGSIHPFGLLPTGNSDSCDYIQYPAAGKPFARHAGAIPASACTQPERPEPDLAMSRHNFVHPSLQLHKAGARDLQRRSANAAGTAFLAFVSHSNNMKRKEFRDRDRLSARLLRNRRAHSTTGSSKDKPDRGNNLRRTVSQSFIHHLTGDFL
jgi:hypothetical protein